MLSLFEICTPRKKVEGPNYKWIEKDYTDLGYNLWQLILFPSNKERKNKKVPFLHKIEDVSQHCIDLKLFDKPKQYVPLLKFDEEGYSSFKIQESIGGDYNGQIDAEINLVYYDSMDAETRAIAGFFNGEYKTGFTPVRNRGIERRDLTLNNFKEGLNDYLRDYKVPLFGDYLPRFFLESNLSQEARDAVKELLKVKQ